MSASFQVLRFAVSFPNPRFPMPSSFPVNLVTTASPSVSIASGQANDQGLCILPVIAGLQCPVQAIEISRYSPLTTLLRLSSLPGCGSKLTACIRSTAHHLLLLLFITNDSTLWCLVHGQWSRCRLLRVLHGPVEHIVVLEAFSDEQVSEELSQVRVVRLVVESQGPAVVEVNSKLVGMTSAKDFRRGRHLLLHDSVVLLLLGRRFETLPGQGTSQKVHEHVAQGLEVVSSRLFDTEMGVDRGISSGTGQVLVLSIGDVQVGLGVPVLFRQTEIDHVDLVAPLADTHQKVIRLDISMDKVSRMDVFDSRNLQ